MSTKTKDVRAVLTRDARAEASADGSAGIEVEHLLLALAALEGSTASRLLREAGLDRAAVRVALEREWEQSLAVAGVSVEVNRLPRATPDPNRQPQFTASATQALKVAAATTGGRMSSTQLLVGVLSGRLGRVARTLDVAGVDRDALRTRAEEAAQRGEH